MLPASLEIYPRHYPLGSKRFVDAPQVDGSGRNEFTPKVLELWPPVCVTKFRDPVGAPTLLDSKAIAQ